MKLKIIPLILFILYLNLPSIAFSQNTTLDSLKTYNRQDSIRVNLLNKLAYNLRFESVEKSLLYIEESAILADKIGYKKGKAESFFLSGDAQLNLYNFKKAREYYEKSIMLYEAIPNKKGVSKCLNDIGASYFMQGSYTLALDCYKKTLVINEKLNAKENLSISLSNIGMIYDVQGNYKKALEYYNKSLLIEEELGNKNGIAEVYNNIGNMYSKENNYPLALKLYNNALIIYEQLGKGYETQTSTCLYNIGLVYKLYENYNKALEYYEKSLKIEEQVGNKRNIAFCLMGMGSVYSKQRKQVQATDFIKRALTIFTKIKDSTHIASCLNNLGDTYLLDNNYDLAFQYYEDALKINLKKKFLSSACHSYLSLGEIHYSKKEYRKALINALYGQKIANKSKLLKYQNQANELLSKIYYSTGKFKEAYKRQLVHKQLSDSLFNKKNIQKITQIEYEYEYKERLLSAEKRENSLKEEVKTIDKELEISEQEKLWGIIGFLGLVLLLSLIIFLLQIRSLKTVSENILIEQKLLRSQMTPHFIFNSLSVLQGIILNKEYLKSIKYLSGFSKLLRLTLENSRDKVVLLKNELEAIKNYLTLQNLGTENRYNYKITVAKNIDENAILIPPMLIQPFIENAIEHGFKNKKVDRQITILIKFDKINLMCSIIDNGIGIDTYKQEANSKKQSLATTITSERLKMFSKEFNLQTDIIIKDRKHNGDQGTIVILTLPYKIIKND